MRVVTVELARRTAATAVPFAERLAVDFETVSRLLRAGHLEDAMANFASLADRLERFLTFLVVLRDVAPSGIAPRPVQDFRGQLFAIVDRMHECLDRKDLVSLAMVLSQGVAKHLRSYAGVAPSVDAMLEPLDAAA
jgi:hypothetical protein